MNTRVSNINMWKYRTIQAALTQIKLIFFSHSYYVIEHLSRVSVSLFVKNMLDIIGKNFDASSICGTAGPWGNLQPLIVSDDVCSVM